MDNKPSAQPPLTIYQWNCRSFKGKKAALDHYVATQPADIIALQETDTAHPTLRGFDTYTNPPHSRTAILVARTLTAQVIPLVSSTDHVLIELVPRNSSSPSIFVLNIYSPPTHSLTDIETLFKAAARQANSNPCIVLGDFNAPHIAWGYPRATKKGTALLQASQLHHFALQNDVTQPTRIGTSVTRDTIPDLTFARHTNNLTWSLLPDTLGSDHHIIKITLPSAHHRHRIGVAKLTDWKAFREDPLPRLTPSEDLDRWVHGLLETQSRHTKRIDLTPELPAVDAHLDHLWEARHGLLNRWRRNKHNRNLKRRIAHLTKTALQYARQLLNQNWITFCNELAGTLTTKRAWHILRSLMGTTTSKTATNQTISRLIHNNAQPPDSLLASIRNRLFATASTPSSHPDYKGAPNEALDAPFTRTELLRALSTLTRNTAPGHDHITYKLLRNLDEQNIDALLDYYNHHWAHGTLPPQWRHADISLLPKPNKPVHLDNLRPISLTSCAGKLLEHLVTRRLTAHLNDTEQLPHTMFGFRAHLSAQDIHLQLKADIIDRLSKTHPSTILALDIKGAFDNVSHTAILNQLQTTGCGQSTYNYVRAFLTDRTATISIGPHRSDRFNTPAKGTPQGSVISPLLFNIAMAGLPPLLSNIPDISHALYADDITIWTNKGSPGYQQDNLQQATDTVTNYLRTCGLHCAPAKSALLILRSRTRGRPPLPTPDPEISIDGQPVPTVPTLRILGVQYHHDGSGAAFLPRLQKTVAQLTHLIQRVCSRRHGLKEADTCRILQAMLTSRITYGAPYLALKPQETAKIDTLIRKAYKSALGLPAYTSTDRLLQLGLHNTLSELIEAHTTSQLHRLQITATGRHLLGRLGHPTAPTPETFCNLSTQAQAVIHVLPIPKHMHPVFNAGRRQHRARLLLKKYGANPDVYYTDAAPYRTYPAHAIAAISSTNAITASATIPTTSIDTAEEAAIALAITNAPSSDITVLTDSQSACRRYATGRITRISSNILARRPALPTTRIVWIPGHTSLPGNEVAHATARALTYRAFPEETNEVPAHDDLTLHPLPPTYSDILAHYRNSRRLYPPPHPSLSTTDARIWRRLQTQTYHNHTCLHFVSPTLYAFNCPSCNTPNTTMHLVWTCPSNPPLPTPFTHSPEHWERVLRCSQLEEQEALILRAKAAATARGLPE